MAILFYQENFFPDFNQNLMEKGYFPPWILTKKECEKAYKEDEFVFDMEKKRKVGVIIQARLNASRFPRKVMVNLAGKPLLEHLIDNLKKAKKVDEIIIATTKNKEDNEIVELAKKNNISFFRGPEEDVLKRFILAAEKFDLDVVVRICADCPLVNPEELDNLVENYINRNFDYTTNTLEVHKGLPFRLETFSKDLLRKLDTLAFEKKHREHVTLFVIDNKDKFKIQLIEPEIIRPDLQLDLDEPEDLKNLEMIYNKLYKPGEVIKHKDVVKLLDKENEFIIS